MTQMNRPVERVLLMLDLAEENQFHPDQILEQCAGSPTTKVFSATEFGAARTGRGWSPEHRQDHSKAIEAMVSAARPYIDYRTELLVSGRAGLASHAELGLRISSWHDNVTMVNQRRTDRQWDFCTLNGADDGESYFDQIHFPARPKSDRGRVAVVVSSGFDVDPDDIGNFFKKHNEKLLSTVTLRAVPPDGEALKQVTVRNTPGLARSLCVEFTKIKMKYPGQRGLVVFVAGPAQLAFLTGRAINPNVYSSVWFPHHHDKRYSTGSKIPWRDKVRIRMLLSEPEELSAVDLSQEELLAAEILDRPRSRDRCDLTVKHSASFHDFFDMLLHDRPQIVHFSGHGSENALAFVDENGNKLDVVPAEAIQRGLRSASDPLEPPRLVILNACKTMPQAEEMTEHVDFAIGMKPNIKDQRAIAFTRRFYEAIAMGRSLKNAFDQTRDFLSKDGAKADDTPHLFCRPGCDPDGLRFFDPE